jgi:hypothetical protein
MEQLAAQLRRELAAGRRIYLWPDVINPRSDTLAYYGAEYRQFIESFHTRLCGRDTAGAALGLTAYQVRCIS